jgi:AbrB family transcriptional regulator (stage V sporulation protein T)
MKNTGIVRRIDDLGRIVIPKEIRKPLRIREGDQLQLFVDRDGRIIFEKCSSLSQLEEFTQEYCDSLYETTGHISLIGDRDVIISVSGGSKKLHLGQLTENYGKIDDRKIILEDTKVFVPIVAEGDLIGAIILLAQEDFTSKFGDFEIKIAQAGASFLAKTISD